MSECSTALTHVVDLAKVFFLFALPGHTHNYKLDVSIADIA